MINALLVVLVLAALVIAGITLEKHTNKVGEEKIKEFEKEEIVIPASEVPDEIKEAMVAAPTTTTTIAPKVKKMVEAQEAPVEKPKPRRKPGRPAAKKA